MESILSLDVHGLDHEKKFSFIGIEFKFVGSHPVLNRDKALL